MGKQEHLPDPEYNKGPSLAELRAAQNELLEQDGQAADGSSGGLRDASQTDAYNEEVMNYRRKNPRLGSDPDD